MHSLNATELSINTRCSIIQIRAVSSTPRSSCGFLTRLCKGSKLLYCLTPRTTMQSRVCRQQSKDSRSWRIQFSDPELASHLNGLSPPLSRMLYNACTTCEYIFLYSGEYSCKLNLLRDNCVNCQVLLTIIQPIRHIIPAHCSVHIRVRKDPTFTIYLTSPPEEIRTFDLILQVFAPSGKCVV